MFDEPFSEGQSFLHKADPRMKLVVAVVFSMVVAVTRSPVAAGAALVPAMFWVLHARLASTRVLLRLGAVNGFVLFMWVMVPPTYGGPAAFHIGPVPFSAAGLRLTLLITLKCNAIALAFMGLAATTPLPALGSALRSLGVPSSLCQLLLFTYRYVHVLRQEYSRLSTAARIRGFSPRTNVHTYRTYAYMTAMLLVRSLDRADRVHRAMKLRGFDGTFRSLDTFRLRRRDMAYGLLMLAVSTGLAVLGSLQGLS